MKYKILIAITSLSLLFSCVTDKSKSRTQTVLKKSEDIVSVDTGKTTTELTNEVSTKYGDTLKASLYFSDASLLSDTTAESDSIESAGIKVIGTLTKISGGYKMKLNAVAKPVLKTDIVKFTKTEQKGLAVTTHVKTDSTKAEYLQHKQIRAGPAWYCWLLLILFLIILLLRVFWKPFKKFIL